MTAMEAAGVMMSRAASEIEALRAALKLIAAKRGMTMLCPDGERDAFDSGCAAGYAECASIAQCALDSSANRNADL